MAALEHALLTGQLGPVDPNDVGSVSASSIPANGPGPMAASSTTRTPASGPVTIDYRRSMIVALAMPPPSHMVCSPYRPPVASRWFEQRRHQPGAGRAERVAEGDRAAARVEPLGVGADARCSQASGTGANASFTS